LISLGNNFVDWKGKGVEDEIRHLSEKKDKIAAAIRKRLWNSKFFADWHDFARQDYFYSLGNMLVIAWGFATDKEMASIFAEMEKISVDFTFETNEPKYPWWRIDLGHHLVGMGNYQNKSTLWYQPACAYVAAQAAKGDMDKANRQLSLIYNQVEKSGRVYECFDRNGRPFRTRFYRAEMPFAWAAGMIIWAASLVSPRESLFKQKSRNKDKKSYA
jgi:hypothetical protein